MTMFRSIKFQQLSGVFTISRNTMASEASFDVKPYKLHKLEASPETKVMLTAEDGLKYYRQMQTIRRMETTSGNLYKEKVIRGFCHLYNGQEACAVGMKAAMRHGDSIISGYRIHGWAYLMGVSPASVLSELCGKKSGCARGKGGSMHMYAPFFFGGQGIVGAQVPLGAGVAFARKYLDTKTVCFALYGDGASNQGQVFEAYNMSKLWDLPCIFVCENNGYGMGTSASRSSASVNYYMRGDYIPGIQVDGMDVLAVREATRFAIAHCISGRGPLVMEVACYRYSGHSMSDPGTSYRTREEVQDVRQKRDPITSFREKIVNAGFATLEELKKMDTEIKKEIDEAEKIARSDTEAGMDDLSGDIYSKPAELNIRGTHPWSTLVHKNINKPLNL